MEMIMSDTFRISSSSVQETTQCLFQKKGAGNNPAYLSKSNEGC